MSEHRSSVLVVEDDERVRSISSESLRDLGYTVIEAASAKEALQQIEGGLIPDLLFTDVVMPEIPAPSSRLSCRNGGLD